MNNNFDPKEGEVKEPAEALPPTGEPVNTEGDNAGTGEATPDGEGEGAQG